MSEGEQTETQSQADDSEYRPPHEEELSVTESAEAIAARLNRPQQRRGATSTPARRTHPQQGPVRPNQRAVITPARQRNADRSPQRTPRPLPGSYAKKSKQ